MASFTPMMQQYFKVKEQYKDAILFFRLGDFYEMFFDDAKTASKELELVLTGRDCGQPERAPMCGIPYHAADSYIAKLVSKGYKVAVCEQTEDPASAKGIVTRDVIRVHTPGTVIESSMLDEDKNNYLGCLYLREDGAGVCFSDVSTGEIHVTQFTGKHAEDKVINETARFLPSEILVSDSIEKYAKLREYLTRKVTVFAENLPDDCFAYGKCIDIIKNQFPEDVIKRTEIESKQYALGALGAAVDYLISVQKSSLENINDFDCYNDEKYMTLNASARQHLELTETQRRREKKGSLLWALDYTKTAMGKRLIRSWIEQPLVSVAHITSRLNAVEELFSDASLREELIADMQGINDIERIVTRIVYGTANAKELRALSQTLAKLVPIKLLLKNRHSAMLNDIGEEIDTLTDITELIDSAITDEPPFTVREGGMIRDGFNPELDELRTIVSGGKGFLASIESAEQEKTGIKKLKIGYNRVFGYYIEVPNSFKELVPDDYIRKQTLVNCERFITPELKELESKVLGAQERISKLEYELFVQVRQRVADAQFRLRASADAIAKTDTLCSFAYAAVENSYERPDVDNSDEIIIKGGRHPVVEKFSDGAPFVPNDTMLDCSKNRTLIITGPNMAGKSTYMRQTALIALMAQIGSFVPAKSAKIGVVDSIFTRIGASDDLAGGQSTFMVEMSEVSSILENATSKSLIILDEIGRGTSTYDGMSIARAVLEYVTDKKKLGAKTLFATHYHELTELENEFDGVINYNTSVKRRGDSITFLRRIVRGPADGSFGIEVAKLAGLPQSIINRSKVILKKLEETGSVPVVIKHEKAGDDSGQISFEREAGDDVIEELRKTDVNTLTPIEALTLIYELKKKIN